MMNNKTLFEIYLIFRLFIFITILIISGMIITRVVLKIDLVQMIFPYYGNYIENPLMALNWLSIFFLIIDERIKPGYIEYQLMDDEISIKTYNPHSTRWESPFVLWGYKKRIKAFKINREEYTNYNLILGKFGIKKELRLQKINNDGVYQSARINISLLGQKKYTNLIVAIDRLRTKICMN